MLAFELQGGWKDIKTAVTATVLQFLLGGGGSFSSGGPGVCCVLLLWEKAPRSGHNAAITVTVASKGPRCVWCVSCLMVQCSSALSVLQQLHQVAALSAQLKAVCGLSTARSLF